jgi:hypothetical protein
MICYLVLLGSISSKILEYVLIVFCFYPRSSVAKHLESANTMFSFIWWIIGFYWVSADSQTLAHGSPQLYWFVLVLSYSLKSNHYLYLNLTLDSMMWCAGYV